MKSLPLYILLATLLFGCNAVSTSISPGGQVPLEVPNASVVAYCENPATATPIMASNSSQTDMLSVNTCVVELPKALHSSRYCSNPDANWGGVNITIPPLGQYGYVSYPKNCTLNKSKYGENQVLLCNGPAGSSVTIKVTDTCKPPSAMAPDLPLSCPAPFYSKSKNPNDQFCAYTGFVVPTPAPVQPSAGSRILLPGCQSLHLRK